MGRTAYAEQTYLDYLKSLKRRDGFIIGLILGQSSGQKDFIVHLARTPPPAPKDIVDETSSKSSEIEREPISEYVKNVSEIRENWVADHARHVTRMLPGGMNVLGIFIVGPADCLADSNCVRKFKMILSAIQKNLKANKYLYGTNEQENLILNFNSTNESIVCKSIGNGDNEILKPADCKFSAKVTKWHLLETLIELDHLFPEYNSPLPLKRHLQEILENVSKVIDASLFTIEGEVRDASETLEVICKKRKTPTKKEYKEEKDAEEKPLQVGLYIPYSKSLSNSSVVTIKPSNGSMRLVGQLVSRTCVHQKASVDEAMLALKQDVVRSLASRLEMHSDSLIEEEDGSIEESITLHEPPRRVLIQLPQSQVSFSDYLFPGEGAQEALISLQELLDLQVQESSVQKELELQVDPTEFYNRNDIAEVPETGSDMIETHKFTFLLTGVSVAILILIFAIVFNQLQ